MSERSESVSVILSKVFTCGKMYHIMVTTGAIIKKKILVFMKQRWTETVALLRASSWGWTGFLISDLGTGIQSQDAAEISALGTDKWTISVVVHQQGGHSHP